MEQDQFNKILTIEKTIRNEIRKWISFDLDIYFINDNIRTCYHKISSGDYDSKKKSFIKLHYLKIKKEYILLKIYHDYIKKISSNEKLLKYFEFTLLAHGFNV